MENFILTIHILSCVFLIILVLLQSGKEGMGVIFGGGSSSLFGSTGAGGFMVKLTAFVGALFLVTSLLYNVLSSGPRQTGSLMENVEVTEPIAPVQAPTPPLATGVEIEDSGAGQAPAEMTPEVQESVDQAVNEALGLEAPAAPATDNPAAQ